MKYALLRRAIGGAVAATLLVGCQGRTLFDDDLPPTVEPSSEMAAVSRHIATDALSATLGEQATLVDYQRYAALNSPDLRARFHEWQAALERIPQVGALPDPRLTYGYYLGEVETRVGPMQHAIAVSQAFPWFDELQHREDGAARAANAAYRRLEAAHLQLRYHVERTWNELYYLEQSIDVTGDTIELLQQFERVIQARYRVSDASHPDIIRIQVAIGTAADQLRRLDDQRGPSVARLNALLNRPSDAPITWPESVSGRVITQTADQLATTLRDHSPELLALDEEIERARAATEIARTDARPELTVGVGYTVIGERGGLELPENGDDALLASVSMNIPLWREKYDAAVRESVSRRLAVAHRRHARLNEMIADLHEAVFRHDDAQRRIALYRDTLLPKATESLHASTAGFEQGTADFLSLLDTQRTLLDLQLALERARVDRATSAADIERLIGARLPLKTEASR